MGNVHRNVTGKRQHLLAAAVLAAVWICSPLLSVVHGLVEEHTYCAEHQRLEEDAHAAPDSDEHEHEGTLAYQERESEDSDAHTDCAFAEVFTRDAQETQAPAFVLDASGVMVAPATCYAGIPALPIALLALAPKASPPIIAS